MSGRISSIKMDGGLPFAHRLVALAIRWLSLHEEIKTHGGQLEALTKQLAPQMIGRSGVGFDTAAELFVASGDNTDRVHSVAAFAKLCGPRHPCRVRKGQRTTPPQPRRKPLGQRCAPACFHRPHALVFQPTIAYVN